MKGIVSNRTKKPLQHLLNVLLLVFSTGLVAQTSLTQSFRFESGVYKTFEEFQKNRPSYNAADIEGNFFINDQTRQAKVEYIRLKKNKTNLNLEELWGIVIKGIPYIKTNPSLPSHHLKVFASLEVRGNICYYAYDDIEEKEFLFKAYNPLIGKPFRSGSQKRKVSVVKEKILRFETGETVDFNYQNLLKWLEDDKEITKALKSLGPEKAEDRLFDALLLYNDKHLIPIK